MRVLVACEESGVIRDAFAEHGHEAMSCDLQETSKPGNHYKGDVEDILYDRWDMIIAHPPCQFLSNSGVRWLFNDDGAFNAIRYEGMQEGREFFMKFWRLRHTTKLVIENPIPHGYAGLPPYTQSVHPWEFGDNFSKTTCLWVYGLPPLVPQVLSEPEDVIHAVHWEAPSPERSKIRSKTYPSIAKAMAEQWGTDWIPNLELTA